VGLSAGQKLTFSVIFGPTNAGSAPGAVTITSNATGSPAQIALSGTGVTPSAHSVSLTWDASTSSVVGYYVYRSTTSGTGYTKLNASSAATGLTYADSTVENGTTYYYVTTAVDSSGTESSYSNQAQAIIP
jgi:TolB protein